MAQDGDTTGTAVHDKVQQEEEPPTTPHHPQTQIALADGTTTAPGASTPAAREVQGGDEDGNGIDASASAASPGLRNSKGWDGKLRLPKKASASVVLANPEALSDPEYSDDDNVVPGETISADEDLLNDEDPDTDEIICTHARVHSIDALRLERFPRCQRLCLRQNGIQSITSGLAPLAGSLKDLDLYDNLVTHMRGVEHLPNLTSLDLSFNKIKHIKHLAPLTKLVDLYLVANKVASVDGLAELSETAAAKTLRMLELGSNRIRTIAPLGGFGLVALEELWLAKNKITSLEGLRGLPKLKLLSVQSNRIRDLSPLRDVPTLEELYVSHNALESLESLAGGLPEAEGPAGVEGPEAEGPPEGGPKAAAGGEAASGESTTATTPTPTPSPMLPLLRVLDVGNNQLTSLTGVEHLHSLQEVWVSYNRLADFADVERCLRDKKQLETVYLEGNPLQLRGPALYRNKVRLAVPQVQQIDATYVRDT